VRLSLVLFAADADSVPNPNLPPPKHNLCHKLSPLPRSHQSLLAAGKSFSSSEE
jgi:hypothetical protein